MGCRSHLSSSAPGSVARASLAVSGIVARAVARRTRILRSWVVGHHAAPSPGRGLRPGFGPDATHQFGSALSARDSAARFALTGFGPTTGKNRTDDGQGVVGSSPSAASAGAPDPNCSPRMNAPVEWIRVRRLLDWFHPVVRFALPLFGAAIATVVCGSGGLGGPRDCQGSELFSDVGEQIGVLSDVLGEGGVVV